jgi:hypothetical protein
MKVSPFSRFVVGQFTFLLLAAMLVLPHSAARAESGAYAEFTGARVNLPGTDWLYGPTFGFFSEKAFGPVHLGYDVRGIVLTNSGGAGMQSVVVGPRLSIHPSALPFAPYLQAGVGLGHGSTGGTNSYSATKFEYQFLAGADHRIAPRVDWRVIEFSYGALSGLSGSFNPKSLSTGLIFHF